jgi:hypothetical protein
LGGQNLGGTGYIGNACTTVRDGPADLQRISSRKQVVSATRPRASQLANLRYDQVSKVNNMIADTSTAGLAPVIGRVFPGRAGPGQRIPDRSAIGARRCCPVRKRWRRAFQTMSTPVPQRCSEGVNDAIELPPVSHNINAYAQQISQAERCHYQGAEFRWTTA